MIDLYEKYEICRKNNQQLIMALAASTEEEQRLRNQIVEDAYGVKLGVTSLQVGDREFIPCEVLHIDKDTKVVEFLGKELNYWQYFTYDFEANTGKLNERENATS